MAAVDDLSPDMSFFSLYDFFCCMLYRYQMLMSNACFFLMCIYSVYSSVYLYLDIFPALL